MMNTTQTDKFHTIVTMERDLKHAKVGVGFGYNYADKVRNAKRMDRIEADLFAALDALTIEELHALGEYREEYVIGGIGGYVL